MQRISWWITAGIVLIGLGINPFLATLPKGSDINRSPPAEIKGGDQNVFASVRYEPKLAVDYGAAKGSFIILEAIPRAGILLAPPEVLAPQGPRDLRIAEKPAKEQQGEFTTWTWGVSVGHSQTIDKYEVALQTRLRYVVPKEGALPEVVDVPIEFSVGIEMLDFGFWFYVVAVLAGVLAKAVPLDNVVAGAMASPKQAWRPAVSLLASVVLSVLIYLSLKEYITTEVLWLRLILGVGAGLGIDLAAVQGGKLRGLPARHG